LPSNQNQAVATGIILITLLLCAYFLAQGSMGLLAHALFSDTSGATVALPGSAHLTMRRETKTNEAIVARNIFGPDVSLLPPMEVDADLMLGEDGEPVFEDDGGIITRCDGNVRLVAAVVHPKNTAMSVAGLSEGPAKATLYREGMSVGGRTVVAISPHRVILGQPTGRLCEIPMWRPDLPPPTARPVPSNVAEAIQQATDAQAERPSPSDRNAGLTNDEMAAGISKVDDENYTVTRDVFEKMLEDPSALSGLARGIAHEENGKVVGMKLYGIRRTALLGRLGVQNGDMLRTVNGFDVSNMQGDADSALNALTAVRGSNKVTVSVIRRGKPVTLEYTVN
jgi:general secretion pathway protein C